MKTSRKIPFLNFSSNEDILGSLNTSRLLLHRVTRGAPNDNFRKNICSEDDLRSRIFGTFVVKFLACLPLRIFEHLKNGKIAYFQRIFTLKRSPRIFGRLFSG